MGGERCNAIEGGKKCFAVFSGDLAPALIALGAKIRLFSARSERTLLLRDFYKDQRDSFGWYFLILYLVNIADAYVDASLSGFDVGTNLGFRGGPPGNAALPPSVTFRIWLR